MRQTSGGYRRVLLSENAPAAAAAPRARKGAQPARRSCSIRQGPTLPPADDLGGSPDSRSCSTLMCPAAFRGSLSRPCFPCGLRLLFNSPSQSLAQRNQGMPVTQSEKNLAGLLVYGSVGISLVRSLNDMDATHNPTPTSRS
jgi:hypothetical protein